MKVTNIDVNNYQIFKLNRQVLNTRNLFIYIDTDNSGLKVPGHY